MCWNCTQNLYDNHNTCKISVGFSIFRVLSHNYLIFIFLNSLGSPFSGESIEVTEASVISCGHSAGKGTTKILGFQAPAHHITLTLWERVYSETFRHKLPCASDRGQPASRGQTWPVGFLDNWASDMSWNWPNWAPMKAGLCQWGGPSVSVTLSVSVMRSVRCRHSSLA